MKDCLVPPVFPRHFIHILQLKIFLYLFSLDITVLVSQKSRHSKPGQMSPLYVPSPPSLHPTRWEDCSEFSMIVDGRSVGQILDLLVVRRLTVGSAEWRGWPWHGYCASTGWILDRTFSLSLCAARHDLWLLQTKTTWPIIWPKWPVNSVSFSSFSSTKSTFHQLT